MLNYRLYQDGEINFTLQSPDNSTLAIFSVNQQENFYKVNKLDLRKQGTPLRTLIYHGSKKELAIRSAYEAALYFSKTLDANFEDRTEIRKRELEETIQKEADELFHRPFDSD